jgi:hypothetical protein
MAQLLLNGTELTTGSNLEWALQLVENRLAAWASNTDAYNFLLLEVFRVQSSDATSALQASLSGTGLGIGLEILAGEALSGINGAYTSAAPDGGERIYLNAAWLQGASAAQIEAVLLEELGHAIDTRLNGTKDSPGDEGEIFSALLRGQQAAASAATENDQRLISINGISTAIEAADTTPPLALTTAPAYAAASINAFGITDVASVASPSLADIDGDGDLDAFIGNSDGNTLFFRNTVAAGSTNPGYAAASTNAFGITDVASVASPSFVDIDGDGDLDAFIGNKDGNTLFFRNTAAAGSTNPAYAAASTNPFGITDVGSWASPSLVDIDGDGDLDAFIGNRDGNTLFFRNTAVVGSTNPAYAAASTNAFGITDVGSWASPSLVDIDGDGDLDAFIGEYYGNTLFFRNTAAAGSTNPAYAAARINAFGITDVASVASPSFVDIDADGDLDAFIGNNDGNTLFFRNTAPVLGVSSTSANGSYGVGAVINITITFSEAVLVTGTPRLQLETGAIDRYATYSSGSGTNTLSFSYTVQVGDSSADLDLLSANALSLNGGTIRDAAGNNALLTLAAPGSPSSLAARKNLVITTTTAPIVAITSIGGADGTVSVQTGDATVVGTAAANRLVTIKYGATTLGTTTANGSGGFSYTLTAANLITIGQGTGKSITASQRDAAGNTGTSPGFRFAVDTTAPATTAAVTAITDNVGAIQGTLAASAFTDDSTPSFGGTISAFLATGENLSIFNGTTLLGNATVNNANSTWSFTPTTALANGFYAVTARVADAAGNLAPASTAQRFSIDSTANQKIGDANANPLTATTAKDVLTGLGGVDTFKFTALTSSTLANFDRITDFSIGTDILDGPTAVAAANINKLGAVSALGATSISTVLTASTFLANRAATFSYADPSGISRSFIALNNGTAGYQAGADAIIEITGYTGSLDSLQVI